MPISIELYTPDEDDKRKIEDIIQDKHLSPSELHLTTMQLSRIEQLFTMLNFREREILRLRFGFKDGIPRTLAETGKVFRIIRERIR
jgi:RNA polymerase primary sigma factor